jgi:hypothetical protein
MECLKGELLMTTETILQIAERNMNKAQIAMNNNYDRKGITEQEKENLTNNVEYTQIVYDLISRYVKYLDGGSYED